MWHICNLLLTARQCRPVTVTAFSAWLAVDEIIISSSIHLHLYLIPLSGKNADSWFSYIITPPPAFCIFITVDVLASSSSSAQNAPIPVFVSSALTVPHDPVMCCFLRRLFRNRLSSASTRNSSELMAFPRPLGICTQCKSSWSGGQSCCSMGRPQWLWHAEQSRTPFFFSWMSFLLSSYIQSLFFFFFFSSPLPFATSSYFPPPFLSGNRGLWRHWPQYQFAEDEELNESKWNTKTSLTQLKPHTH